MDRPPGWRRLFRIRDRDLDAAIDDELRFHLDMRTEEQLRRGVPEVVARRAALARFGDVTAVQHALGTIDRERDRADRRREAVMDLGQDIAFAFRVLARKPLTAVIIVLCLALGIGSATTVVSVGDALLLRPLPYPTGDRLVQVGTARGDNRMRVASFEDYTDWRLRQRTFDALGAIQRETYTIVTDETVRLATGASVTSTMFGALGIRPLRGRLFSAGDDEAGAPAVVVVTASFADRLLGGVDRTVGSTLRLGERRLEVVGVIATASSYPDGVEVFTSMPRRPDPGQRGTRSLDLIGAMRPGVSVEAARQDLARISAAVARDDSAIDSTVTAAVRPLRERYVGDARPAFGAIAAAAGLLLVIACANVASLQLARGSARAREIGVRSALGATRGRVLRLLLTESVILAVLGGLAGVGVTLLAARVVALSIPAQFAAWMTPQLDVRVLAATLLVSMLTGVVFGLVPALRLSRLAPIRTLREGSRSGIDPTRLALQRTFVAIQMALSVVLLVGAAMAATSFSRLTSQDPGFTTERVLTFRIALRGDRYEDAGRRIQLTESAIEQLRALPEVEAVAAASHVPVADCCSRFGLHVEGEVRRNETERMVTGNVVTSDFFSTLGIRFVSGHTFRPSDRLGAPSVVVINETFARDLFAGREPLGRTVHISGRDATVIGVVRDVRQTTLMDDPEPQFYLPQSQDAWDGLTFVVRLRQGTVVQPVIDAARGILQSLDPVLALYRAVPLEQIVSNAVTSQRTFRTLLQGFALIALLLAAAGMYGVTSYYVAQRIPELGIRLALGAQPSSVVRLILRQGAVLAGIGAIAGIGGAAVAAIVLSKLLYGVEPGEPSTYLLATGLLALTTLLACIGPARRATRIEPLTALRSE